MSHGIRTFALVDAVGQVGGADLEAFALLLRGTTRGIVVGAFWGHGNGRSEVVRNQNGRKSRARLVSSRLTAKVSEARNFHLGLGADGPCT